jgi:hypothetical protein
LRIDQFTDRSSVFLDHYFIAFRSIEYVGKEEISCFYDAMTRNLINQHNEAGMNTLMDVLDGPFEDRYTACLAMDCVLPYWLANINKHYVEALSNKPHTDPVVVYTRVTDITARNTKKKKSKPIKAPLSVVDVTPGWKDVICQESLPDFHGIIIDTLHSNAAVKDTMRHHIISKLAPCAGISRVFSSLAARYMARNTMFRKEMTLFLACSLLGNYSHCPPTTRARIQLRLFVYSVVYPDVFSHKGCEHNKATWDLFYQAPLDKLFLMAMREYLIYHVADDPVLEEVLKERFDYDSFKKETIEGMGKVRQFFNHALRETGSMSEHELSLSVACDEKSPMARKWQVDLHALLKETYEKAKDHGYRRTKLDPCIQLRIPKGRLPPLTKFAIRARIQVYLKDKPRSDEKCSTTRRKSRLSKRKATEAFDEGNAGDTLAVARPDEETDMKAPARKASKHDDDNDSKHEMATFEAKMHLDMVRRWQANLKKEAARNAKESKEAEEDHEEETTRLAEEEGGDNNRVTDRFGFATAYLAKLERNALDDASKAILEKYKAKRAAHIAKEDKQKTQEREEHEAEIRKWVLPRTVGETTPGCVPLTRDRITVAHDVVLRACMKHIHPRTSGMDAFMQIGVCVQFLGASPSGVNAMEMLMHDQDAGVYTQDEWINRLKPIREHFSYTYNLYQAAMSMWNMGYVMVTEQLPLSTMISQMRAIAQRYRLQPYGCMDIPKALPKRACRFMWCQVCGTIYSIVQKKVKEGKTVYTHGFQNPCVDLLRGTLHCRLPITVGSDNCADHVLKDVDALGKVVSLRKNVAIMMCPQPGCGIFFPINTYTTMWNEHGPSCNVCAETARSRRHLVPKFIIDLTQESIRPSGAPLNYDLREGAMIPPPKQCFKCGKALQLNHPIGIFGLETFLCAKHGTYKLGVFVRDLLRVNDIPEVVGPGFPDTTMRRLLKEYWKRNEEINDETKFKKNVAIGKRYKAISSNKKAH